MNNKRLVAAAKDAEVQGYRSHCSVSLAIGCTHDFQLRCCCPLEKPPEEHNYHHL